MLTITQVQFREYVADVYLDCVLGDGKLTRNLVVGGATRNQPRHLDFARAQLACPFHSLGIGERSKQTARARRRYYDSALHEEFERGKKLLRGSSNETHPLAPAISARITNVSG
jgi:hypothetical protein